jgi:hypothetical protein
MKRQTILLISILAITSNIISLPSVQAETTECIKSNAAKIDYEKAKLELKNARIAVRNTVGTAKTRELFKKDIDVKASAKAQYLKIWRQSLKDCRVSKHSNLNK